MKHWSKRAAALSLALVLELSPMAAASEAMGGEVLGNRVELSLGTALSKQVFWSDTYSDLRTERYFTYAPNPSVTPTVVYGDKVLDRATLTAMAQGLENQGRRVIGGINGDLYVMATGAPLGVVVTDGILRSVPHRENADYNAVGFRADGTALVGRPGLTATVRFGDIAAPLGGGVNQVRMAKYNYALYTSDFAPTTQNSEPGIDVILTPVLDHVGQDVEIDQGLHHTNWIVNSESASGTFHTVKQSERPTLNGRATYQVEAVLESTGAIAVPEGKAILSVNLKSEAAYVDYLKGLQVGDEVQVDITAAEPGWDEVGQAMGARYRIVTDGQVTTMGLPAERTAYSAVGVKADGTTVFYTVDGKRPGHSIGASLTQVAQRLVELGCVNAVSLDGGGSTTIGATYPDGGNLGVVNKPSDGSERKNSVALFLTTDLTPSGILSGVYVTPGEGLLLSGAQVQMSAQGLDSNYYTMPLSGAPAWSVDSHSGTVDENGLFTAGSESGVTKVAATYDEASGAAALTVVSTPERIALSDAANGQTLTALSVDPNGSVDLNAAAFYRTLPLTVRDECFVWTVDEAVGTIDAQGVFTAAGKSASGNLTVSAGGTSATIPVSVAGHVNLLENFEKDLSAFTPTAGLTLTQEKNVDYVKYGNASLKVGYDADAGSGSLVTTLNFKVGERDLNFWLYGDDSRNSLTATFATADGSTGEVLLSGLDFKGWKYVTAAIPEGAVALRSVNLIYGDSEKRTGAFWLDQLTTSNEPVRDELPPVISLNRSGTSLTATISDFTDKKLTADQVSVTYDGKALAATVEGSAVKATLPAADGRLHRVAVTVTDQSGNIGRAALNVDATATRPSVFTDAAGHWAEPFAVYLYDRKVVTGVPGATEKEVLFQPDKAISRGELFTMAGRWLGLDFTKYESVELPFADRESIPDWALSGVKAMYALGYLNGSVGADGKLYANVGSNITRVEAMTILGRMQAKGYTVGDLSAFADASQVPDWALSYVKTLVGQGVVGGAADNLLHPGDSIRRGEMAKMLFSMT